MNKPILAAASGVCFGLFLASILAFGHGLLQRYTIPTTDCEMDDGLTIQAQPVSVTITVVAEPEPETTPEPEPLPLRSADELLTLAQTAYVNGDYEEAALTAQSAVDDNPLRAWRITGAAACQLHDAALAQQAYAKLDSASRQYLIYVCQRSGLTKRPGHRFLITH